MLRKMGLLLVAVGYLILTVTVPGLSDTAVEVTHSHGVEVGDLLGGIAIAAGVAAIWRR